MTSPASTPSSPHTFGQPVALIGATGTLWALGLTSIALLAVWVVESMAEVIRPLDRWLYPMLWLACTAGALGIGLRKFSVVLGQQLMATLATAYFVVTVAHDAWSGRGTQIYDAATAAPWMLAAHFMLFFAFAPARALTGSAVLLGCVTVMILQLDPADAQQRMTMTFLINAAVCQMLGVGLLYVLKRQFSSVLRSDTLPAAADGEWLTVKDLLHHRARERQQLEDRAEVADAARREHEQELLAMLKAFPGYVARVDAQARLSLVNERMARLHGLTPAQLMGRPVADVVGAERWKEIRDNQDRVLATGVPYTFERVMHDGEGHERHVLATQFAVIDADGRPSAAFYQVGLDVTEMREAQRALERSRAQFDALFAALPLPTLLKDAEGRYLRVNDAYADLLGQRPEDIVGRFTKDLFDADCAAVHEASDAAARHSRQVQRYAVVRPRADGTNIDLLMSKAAAFMPSGEFIGTVSSLFDVTEMNKAQRLMCEAREAAEAANAAKSGFLATMSHEVRTPLNGVIGMAEVLLHSPLSSEQAHHVSTIRDSAQRLLRILGDILDYSKLESGTLELNLAPVDVRALVEDAVRAIEPASRDKGVQLQLTVDPAVPPQVMADEFRLRQILNNLLSNAAKFSARTDGQGAIDVELVVSNASRDLASGSPVGPWYAGWHSSRKQLTIHISDNGIGMDAATARRVFEPFTQGDSSKTRRFGGTGLGLALSQRLAHLMGGRIAVRSEPGQGSVFTLELPLRMSMAAAPEPASELPRDGVREARALAPVAGPALPPAPPPAQTDSAGVATDPASPAALSSTPAARVPPRRYLILVAEDEPVNRMVLTRQLELLGHDAEVANDGEEALRLWRARGHHDLILTDLHMPGMDGYALARAIREPGAPRSNVPIVALTANAMRGEPDKARASGMNEFLTKPIRMHELQSALDRWLAGTLSPADAAAAAAGLSDGAFPASRDPVDVSA